MPNAVRTLHVLIPLVDNAILTGPAHMTLTAAPQTRTVIILTGCAMCLHLTTKITVLSVTMASVQEAVQIWVVTVQTAPQPIPIAMVAMSVRSLSALPMLNAVRTLNAPSVLMEPATLTIPAHTHLTAASLTLTVIIMTGCATCLHLTLQITVLIVTITFVLQVVLTWVVPVPTVPQPILFAMVFMCVKLRQTSVRQILSAMLASQEYVSLIWLCQLNASIALLKMEGKSASQAVNMMVALRTLRTMRYLVAQMPRSATKPPILVEQHLARFCSQRWCSTLMTVLGVTKKESQCS